ncbi:MAG TPA: hypothetical protein VJB06_04100, partial [archaeon]|nr:hypothetical protein [archaeon]
NIDKFSPTATRAIISPIPGHPGSALYEAGGGVNKDISENLGSEVPQNFEGIETQLAFRLSGIFSQDPAQLYFGSSSVFFVQSATGEINQNAIYSSKYSASRLGAVDYFSKEEGKYGAVVFDEQGGLEYYGLNRKYDENLLGHFPLTDADKTIYSPVNGRIIRYEETNGKGKFIPNTFSKEKQRLWDKQDKIFEETKSLLAEALYNTDEGTKIGKGWKWLWGGYNKEAEKQLGKEGEVEISLNLGDLSKIHKSLPEEAKQKIASLGKRFSELNQEIKALEQRNTASGTFGSAEIKGLSVRTDKEGNPLNWELVIKGNFEHPIGEGLLGKSFGRIGKFFQSETAGDTSSQKVAENEKPPETFAQGGSSQEVYPRGLNKEGKTVRLSSPGFALDFNNPLDGFHSTIGDANTKIVDTVVGSKALLELGNYFKENYTLNFFSEFVLGFDKSNSDFQTFSGLRNGSAAWVPVVVEG